MTVVSVSSFSCVSDEQLPKETQPMTSELSIDFTYTYYLDGILVAEGTYDPIDSTLWVATLLYPNSQNYEVNAFTSSTDYINFGNERGLELDKFVAFENEINNFNGEITEEIGNNIYNRIFGSQGSRNPFIFGYDICAESNHGEKTTLLRYQPRYFGMDNRVSLVENPFLWGAIMGWDRPIFFKRLGIFVFWGGGQRICLPDFLDNKISSSILR